MVCVDMTDCSVCLDPVMADTGKTVLKCGHTFHLPCIIIWFSKMNAEASCPNCRIPVDTGVPIYDLPVVVHRRGHIQNIPLICLFICGIIQWIVYSICMTVIIVAIARLIHIPTIVAAVNFVGQLFIRI